MASKHKIYITITVCFFLVFIIILTMPYLNKKSTEPMRERLLCEQNMKALYKMIIEVVQKNNGQITDTKNWCDKLLENTEFHKEVFICPNEDINTIQSSYALNKYILGKTLSAIPEDTVILFESNLGWNGVGNKNDIDFGNHKYPLESTTAGVLLANGDIIFITKDGIDSLRWE